MVIKKKEKVGNKSVVLISLFMFSVREMLFVYCHVLQRDFDLFIYFCMIWILIEGKKLSGMLPSFVLPS